MEASAHSELWANFSWDLKHTNLLHKTGLTKTTDCVSVSKSIVVEFETHHLQVTLGVHVFWMAPVSAVVFSCLTGEQIHTLRICGLWGFCHFFRLLLFGNTRAATAHPSQICLSLLTHPTILLDHFCVCSCTTDTKTKPVLHLDSIHS